MRGEGGIDLLIGLAQSVGIASRPHRRIQRCPTQDRDVLVDVLRVLIVRRRAVDGHAELKGS